MSLPFCVLKEILKDFKEHTQPGSMTEAVSFTRGIRSLRMIIFLFGCRPAGGIMGCVGSKKEQKAPGKGTQDHEVDNPAHTAHYVKDPTATNTKGVSRT